MAVSSHWSHKAQVMLESKSRSESFMVLSSLKWVRLWLVIVALSCMKQGNAQLMCVSGAARLICTEWKAKRKLLRYSSSFGNARLDQAHVFRLQPRRQVQYNSAYILCVTVYAVETMDWGYNKTFFSNAYEITSFCLRAQQEWNLLETKLKKGANLPPLLCAEQLPRRPLNTLLAPKEKGLKSLSSRLLFSVSLSTPSSAPLR